MTQGTPDYASALTVHRRARFKLNTDEWVAAAACIILGFGILAGVLREPPPQVPSCYASSPARR